MHGPAVASIAVGKTVGVAPEADLYFIAQFNGDFDNGKFTWNFEYLARGMHRILEINAQLPVERKIRVISISVGWSPRQKGYEQVAEVAEEARAAGLLVICSSVEEVHGFQFHGLGRPPTGRSRRSPRVRAGLLVGPAVLQPDRKRPSRQPAAGAHGFADHSQPHGGG